MNICFTLHCIDRKSQLFIHVTSPFIIGKSLFISLPLSLQSLLKLLSSLCGQFLSLKWLQTFFWKLSEVQITLDGLLSQKHQRLRFFPQSREHFHLVSEHEIGILPWNFCLHFLLTTEMLNVYIITLLCSGWVDVRYRQSCIMIQTIHIVLQL